ncbi:MAG: EAL domain-containing protein [Alphaproteobacteria bacterium]|uniref:EAL domain-containing protein n=1 Tax=Candidatus Nitrobium versatile TaxID=2884831 RepID=A0A953JAR1_9BACT|nr:EAL domain-containing protein [Candidatus Nitrobium versatile]
MKKPLANRRVSLSTKFILLTSVLVLSTSSIITLFVIRNEFNRTYRDMLNHGRSLAAMMAQNSEYGIYAEDKRALQGVVDSVDSNPDIVYLFIYNKDGQVLVEKHLQRAAREIPVRPPLSAPDGSTQILSREFVDPKDGRHYIDIVAPVASQGWQYIEGLILNDSMDVEPEIIGYVRLGMNKEKVYERIREFLSPTLLFTALLVLLGIALSVYMTRRIVSPIRKLNHAARSIAKGRLDQHIEIGSRDEISDLAHAFNQMLESLRTYRDQVEERTEELYAANRQMQQEISERKKMEERIKHQASHDFLTGLPNRMLFMEHLAMALAKARRERTLLAIMFIDLDRFKNINDSLGHAAGDQLLKDVAVHLRECLREEDTVARIGGDEYTVLLSSIARAEDIAGVARKILSLFERPYSVESHTFHISASIGISTYPDDSEYAETLLKNADIAMYYAKEQGRNNFQFYNPSMNVRTLERMILENRLRQTLDRGELVVHYQPQVSIETRQIAYAEALVRWEHPELGLLNPMHFIPLAEETGFIIPLDEWVLRTACAQNRAWQDAGYPPLCVTVNLSARQFQQPNLVELVLQVLHETGLRPEFLELEITESTAMQNIELTIPNLARLNEMGVRFSIDDFGTGYSSLSYLKKLPIQKLKIDKSFIRSLMKDPDYKAIVTAVIAMAHNLKLKVVAEGVENREQFMFLDENKCDAVQGYFFSEPLPAEEFEALMASDGENRKTLENRPLFP